MELGALKVSKLCEQIAQPLMGLRMIGVKPQSHLVVCACACRVPAAEQQVGQVHGGHWIVRMVSNSLGVDGTCRAPMADRSAPKSFSAPKCVGARLRTSR